ERRLLQWRRSRFSGVALLAGQRRDLLHDTDRNRLSIPDLAAANAALCARRRDFLAPPVRPADEPLLFFLRDDHGPHEFRASLVAGAPRRGLEAENGRHGDDLRWRLRLLQTVDGAVPGL